MRRQPHGQDIVGGERGADAEDPLAEKREGLRRLGPRLRIPNMPEGEQFAEIQSRPVAENVQRKRRSRLGRRGGPLFGPAPFGAFDPVAESQQCLERFHGDSTVVLLLGIREFLVWHEAGMLLPRILPVGSAPPPILQPLPSPGVVGTLCQALGQLQDLRRKHYIRRIDRLRVVSHGRPFLPLPAYSPC